MKKIKLLFLSILLLVTAITLSSCNKTVFYQIAGFYIELVEVDELTVDDRNPKIYFKYGNNVCSLIVNTRLILVYTAIEQRVILSFILYPWINYGINYIYMCLAFERHLIDSITIITVQQAG